MAADLVPDDLWQEISPLIPPRPKPSSKGGRPPADDRDALRAIIHILRTGTPWQMLPTKAFGVSGSTCWRRFTDWAEAGIWPALHQRLLTRVGRLGGIDAQHRMIDSASVRAVLGGITLGRTPRTGRRTAASGT